MAEVLLFHHALGLTPGVVALADRLRERGHAVHTPDLYAGRTFATVDDGVTHAMQIGFEEIVARGVRAAEALSAELYYVGISLGVMPAQRLAQNRAGAQGAVLLEAFVPPSSFGSWPAGVPVQIHGKEADPSFAGEGDLDAARELLDTAGPGVRAELFLYPGEGHLFVDSSLPWYDPDGAAQVVKRVLAFLGSR